MTALSTKQVGQDFLAQNKTKDGVVELSNGLQYRILKSGTGKTAGLKDKVTTHYRGNFIDGKEFDSSYSRGQPATFGVNQVIAGWTQALQLMTEGSIWELFIPSELAYGSRGAGNVIPADSTLIFQIELLSVVS